MIAKLQRLQQRLRSLGTRFMISLRGGQCMLQRIYLTSISWIAILLAGCAPTPSELGFSDQQWQGMNDQQRQQILAGYEQIQRASRNSTVYAGPKIIVTITHGTAMMPPFTQALSYQPVHFEMKPGECRHVLLENLDGSREVKLPVCYNGLTLALDPSHYDLALSSGSMRFNYSPLWKQGFAYNGVSSRGLVHLAKVSVTIHALDKNNFSVTPRVSQQQPLVQKPPVKTKLKAAEEPMTNSAENPAVSDTTENSEKTTEKLAPVEDIENTSH